MPFQGAEMLLGGRLPPLLGVPCRTAQRSIAAEPRPFSWETQKRLQAGRGKYRGEAGTPAFELTPAVLVNILFISQLLAVAGHYLASGYQRAKALKSIKHVSRSDT